MYRSLVDALDVMADGHDGAVRAGRDVANAASAEELAQYVALSGRERHSGRVKTRVQEILELLKLTQLADEHADICPGGQLKPLKIGRR